MSNSLQIPLSMRTLISHPLLTTAAVGALLLGWAPLAPALAQDAERHTLRGADVAIYNLVGETRVVAGNGSDVVVEVARGGRDAARLRTETATLDGRPTFLVRYDGDRIVYPRMRQRGRTQTHIRTDGSFGGRGERGREIEVVGSGPGDEAWTDLTIRVPRGQRIAIHLLVGEIEVTNVDGTLSLHASHAPVRLQQVQGAMTVRSGAGAVSVSGARGDLDVSTGAGSITLASVSGSAVQARSGAGNIDGAGIAASRLSASTGAGQLEFSDFRAEEVSFSSGAGTVRADFAHAVRSARVSSGAGSVRIRAAEGVNAEIVGSTGMGRTSSNIPGAEFNRRRTRVTAVAGTGEGRIQASSGAGSVEVSRLRGGGR
jgi:hypothetical protein